MTTSTLQAPIPLVISTQPSGPHPEISRLLAAAVVDRKFRQCLLQDPVRALNKGYRGKRFAFTKSERDLICSVQAQSLAELAEQLIAFLEINAYDKEYDTEIEIQKVFGK
jgi:hypothetical protein